MKKILTRMAEYIWYRDQFIAVFLAPFSLIFNDIARFRRFLYRIGILKKIKLGIPVIIVGNISVGGTGKTPLVIRLTELLVQAGYRPGIITRGYKGKSEHWPQMVGVDGNPLVLGDEAVMMSKKTRVPVAVGPLRVESAELLMARTNCNIIISDDGLQHYALDRDIEIAVIDGQRRFGNGNCLPGGPLREPIRRLREVDLIVCNGQPVEENEYAMQLNGDLAVNLLSGEKKPLAEFKGMTCHAIAGIGNPSRFFQMLETAGLDCKTHSFPDHFSYQPSDLNFNLNNPVLMTEKDAVKCTGFAKQNHWFVPVQAILPVTFTNHLLKLLKEKSNG